MNLMNMCMKIISSRNRNFSFVFNKKKRKFGYINNLLQQNEYLVSVKIYTRFFFFNSNSPLAMYDCMKGKLKDAQ